MRWRWRGGSQQQEAWPGQQAANAEAAELFRQAWVIDEEIEGSRGGASEPAREPDPGVSDFEAV